MPSRSDRLADTTTAQSSARFVRRVQRLGWDAAIEFYDESWRDLLQPMYSALLKALDPQMSDQIIDWACRTGDLSEAVAQALGPDGRLLATDVSPRMVRFTEQRARAQKLTSINTLAPRDVDDHAGIAEAADKIVYALDLSYQPSPDAQIAAAYRALKPGGQLVMSVWGQRVRCGWADAFMAMDAEAGLPPYPSVFRLGTPHAVETLTQAAGFNDISIEELSLPLICNSADDAIRFAFKANPLILAYRALDATSRSRLHVNFLMSIARFRQGAGYHIPGECLIVTARR